jgi:Protein of unknown function (DUF2970)
MNQIEPVSPQQSLPLKPLPLKRASVFQVTKAMLWGALGVRKLQSYEDDVASITPKQAIIGAIIGLMMFIATILIMVNLAIKYLSS